MYSDENQRTNIIKRTILFILLFIFSCGSKYEMIDGKSRFNKRSGEVEILQDDGRWISKSKELKEKQLREEEHKLEQRLELIDFPWNEKKNITGKSKFLTEYSILTFQSTIENNSNWKIEEIDIVVVIYSESDSTKLITRKFTGKSYDDNKGTPFSKTIYYGDIPKLEDGQYFKWSIDKCRGYKYDG